MGDPAWRRDCLNAVLLFKCFEAIPEPHPPAERDRNLNNFLVSTMSVSEARASLPEVLDRVIAGEEITITRHGKAVAVVVRPDTMRVRRADAALADADRVRDFLIAARATRLSDAPVLSAERADELVASVASCRSR